LKRCTRFCFVAMVVLGMVAGSGLSPVHASTPKAIPSCPARPPSAVVHAYYAAAVRHDRAGVIVCFTPAFAAAYLHGNNAFAPWKNIVSARVMRVTRRPVSLSYVRTQNPPVHAVSAAQLLVVVRLQYRHIGVSPLHEGANTLFFVLVQARRAAPWRIVLIGTGPAPG
jgi:hypothetical protein